MSMNKHSTADPSVVHSASRERMRVLVMATSYPLDDTDNSSVFLRHLYGHLVSDDIEVHVLAPAHLFGGDSIENGIHVHRFRYMPKPLQKLCYGSGILPNLKRQPLLWLVVPLFLASFIFASFRVVLKSRPSVIHAHWFLPTGPIAVFVGQWLRVPVVVTAHGGDAYSMKAGILTSIKKWVARKANVWTANTASTARAITGSTEQGQCRVIPMGVDIELFSNDKSDRKPDNNKLKIIFVGRLVEKKGVDVLLKAVAQLSQETRNRIELKIIGSGQEEQKLKTLAREQGIDSFTKFTGSVSNQDLPIHLSASDLFVGPSIVDSSGDTEGQGVVFLEAMACQLCVVASDVGGIADVIKHGENGLLVPPENVEKLSAIIDKILLDKNERDRLAMNGYKLVQEKYSWTNIADEFRKLYQELVA